MKLVIKKFIGFIIYTIYVLFSPKLFFLIGIRLNQFYSFYKSNEFKSIGNNFIVNFPLYLRGAKYISIGENFNVGLRLRLETYDEHLGHHFTPSIIIGNNVSINSDCHIGAINSIIIEDNVLIASKVFITDHYHGEVNSQAISIPPAERKLFSKGSVKIEKNVWIGEGVVILPNVTIGENSIVGSNSVITKDVPKNTVIGGNPAKIIKTL